jgi:hypothetical protein
MIPMAGNFHDGGDGSPVFPALRAARVPDDQPIWSGGTDSQEIPARPAPLELIVD